jgi:hypothetical protein
LMAVPDLTITHRLLCGARNDVGFEHLWCSTSPAFLLSYNFTNKLN